MAILFYYWRVDAGRDAAAVARRRIVNEVIAPIFLDPIISADTHPLRRLV